MNSPLSLVISVLMLLSAAGVGRACGRLWLAGREDRLERLVISAAMGLGVLSLVFFFLGVFQLYRFKPLILLVAASGLVFVPGMLKEWRGQNQAGKRDIGALVSRALLAVLGLCALIPAMATPAMDDWDSLAYHLAVPKLFLQHGGIYYINFTSHSSFPMLVEMLYLPGLALGSPVAAKLMHFWMGALLVLTVYLLGRKCAGPGAGRLAALATAGIPLVLWEATTAYVDLATALYTVLSAYFLMSFMESTDRRHIIGCSIAAGFAASTKMTGLAIVPILLIWLAVERYAAIRRIVWKEAAIVGGIALLVCSPWYLKSFIYTGNPVYPFFYSIFGGRDWSQALADNYSMLQSRFGLGHDLGAFVSLPYNLTLKSYAFYDRPGLYVGPIVLLGVPVLLLLVQKRTAKLTGLLWFFIAQVVVWFMLSHQSRYLVPAFATLAVVIAGTAYLDERMRLLRASLWAVFAATAAFGVFTLWPSMHSRGAVALGLEGWSSYLSSNLDTYGVQSWVNAELPQDAKVALYGDTRGFYLDRDYVWADPGHNLDFENDSPSADELRDRLKRHGITHVMVNYRFFANGDPAAIRRTSVYEAVVSGVLEPLTSAELCNTAAVYEVK